MLRTLFHPLLARYPRLPDFIALARLDRPIGIWLLLWPTLWAVYIAGGGTPALRQVCVRAARNALTSFTTST